MELEEKIEQNQPLKYPPELQQEIENQTGFVKRYVSSQVSEHLSKKLQEAKTTEQLSRFWKVQDPTDTRNYPFLILARMVCICFSKDYNFYLRKFIGFFQRRQCEGEPPKNTTEYLIKNFPTTYSDETIKEIMSKLI